MRVQQVTVDVWKMLVTAASYLALAFAAWILLRLVSACITLPGYLKKQQEEEEEEERQMLLSLEEEGDLEGEQDEDDEEVDDQMSEEDVDQEVQGPPPATPRASRVRRRLPSVQTAEQLQRPGPAAAPELKAAPQEELAATKQADMEATPATGGGEKKKRK